MLFRKAALITLFILVLLAIAAGGWYWNSQTRLYSSPTSIRTNDTYLLAHAPGKKLPPMPTNFFTSLRVEQTTNEVQVWVPGGFSSPEPDYEPLQVHQAGPSQSVQIGSGSIRLAFVGTAHDVITTNFEWGIRLPAKYYTPDLQPATLSETTNVIQDYDRNLQFDGDFPAASFYFVKSNLPAFKSLNFAAFDARTQHPVTQGYGSSSLSNVFYYNPTIRLWHQTPVEVLLTIATGPQESFSIRPTAGAEIAYPSGIIRLLATADYNLGGTSTRSDGRTNHITLREATQPNWDTRPYCSFVFYCWPNARFRGEVEFYDADGKKLQAYSSGTSGKLYHARINAYLEDVKEIRFQYYPNLHRISFTIPELPGLPEQNRNLENLFDIYVPAIHFQYEHAFQDNIAQVVQMTYSSVPLTFPNAYFPTIRTNTTARALFTEMASLLSNPEHQLVADPVKNKIESRPTPLAALIQKVKKTFRL